MQADLQQSAWPWVAGLFALLVALLLAQMYPYAATALIAGLAAARWHWRHVPIRYYFTSRRIILPVLLLVAGYGGQMSMIVSDTWGSVAYAAEAVVAGAAVVAIFLEHAGNYMKSIFELVPESQQSELDSFLGKAAPQGKFADFSELDQQAVIEQIQSRVVGQDSIVTSVVSTAFRRARLRRPRKPVATYLFAGSTGSGKTELAKALAASLYGDDNRLIRVDCNELSSEHNVSRLVGPPPGYMGSDQGSQFCREIGRVGTGVILFDEAEKAHPAVLKVIMSLLDEGRITEQSTSQTYSATGFLIVLTSNAAAKEIAQIVDAGSEDESERRASVKDALRDAGFLPEVLARIDRVFPFGTLSRAAVAEVVGLFLYRFARDAGIELASVDSALLIDLVTRHEKLADYGIREVVRLVEQAVTDGLLDARDAGFQRAAIRVHGDIVQVEGMR